MKIMFYFLLAVTALSLVSHISSGDAMTQCQKTNSYDTCFQILNR